MSASYKPSMIRMIFHCPHCSAPLQQSASVWTCIDQHSFDIAKEGYINLLVPTKGQSKVAGDSANMIQARRAIHEAGLYQPLAATLSDIIYEPIRKPTAILDIGCGEGYYSRYFHEQMSAHEYYGIDISKAAIKTAAKQNPAIQYAVASAFRVPVKSASVGLATRIFAPSDDAELHRVLSHEGYYLEVGPALRHLWELREALYDDPIPHAPHRVALDRFDLVQQGECHYSFDLNNDQLQHLIAATPFAHKGHREKRALLLQQDHIKVTMAFEWRLFQKLP
jgi:23S rRNA (guanine745-N1)-methyltransferase